MRGVSLRFFKPSVFIKSFLVSCMVFLSAFFSSCKDLAGFDPNVNGERTVASGTFSAPQNLTATNGYRRKITLEWTAVSGASKYEIWCASSNTSSDDEWKIVQVTDKIQYDDKVSAGRTLYYRVRAVKATGVTSRYSTIVKGTSLAVPVISGGEVKDSSVTIQWFMENARGVDGKSNYEDELRFDVYCQKKDGGEPITKTFTASELNSEYKHTFENLAGTTNYQFWIEAYTTKDQSVEKSPVVDVNTLTSYTPLAPEFNATKGESAKGVWLYIYLPEMVMVNTETNDSLNEKVDEPYPLYFKIYRKAGENAGGVYGDNDLVCTALYYNGSTTPPETSYYTSNPYKAGERIEWFDDSEKLTGGQKYTYKVRAFVDANYSKVVCPVGKEYQDQGVGTSETQAKTDTGWKSATPNFNVKEVNKKYSDDESEVLAVEFAFSASWQDLGKAGDYKFAIKQHREPWDSSSGSGEDEWLKTNTGKDFFATLDEVSSYKKEFGVEHLKAEEGVYTYTLYIVRDVKNADTNEDVTISDVETGDDKVVLDSVDAKDKALVTHEVNIPEAELTVKDGYKDKVLLTIHKLNENAKNGETVKYTLIRTKIVDGRPEETSKTFEVDILESAIASGSYEYPDKDVEQNTRYSYVLKATAESGAYNLSDSQDAETLGTPEVAFEMGKLAYDSVTISFNGVLAADYYAVELGVSGEFGNGEKFTITKDADEKWSCDSVPASGAEVVANRFTVTIEKPFGYDDATLAGLSADAVVTAHSDVDSAPSEAVSVNVVGPALVNARVGSSAEATEDSIWVAWDAVEGAKGYLIKRVMYDSVEMKEVADASDVTYYCDGSTVTLVDGSNLGGRATVSDADGKLTLTDNYMEMDTNFDLDQEYQEAQSKIPWGLPFRYVVLPVLDKGDFEFGKASLALASGGKVKYEYFDKTQTQGTATCGYGLNPVAEKAMSGNTQGLKWEKPYNADLRPVVYRREAKSGGSFDLFYENNSLNGKDSANLTIEAKDNFYGAFEYIVKYCSGDPSLKFDVPPSLLKEIAKNTRSYETPNDNKEEQDNKGYLLTLENFDAKVHPNTDYYEQISWKNWDYNTRAVGPDYMVIKVQNNNIDATYHEIVKITNANANSGTEALDVDTTDITAKAEAQATIAVAPKSIVEGSAGTTNGMLKVLRDYKHNYTIELHRARREFDRQDLDGEDDGISVGSEEYADVITAYRQITIDEFTKAAIIGMSTGIEKERGDKGSNVDGNGISGLKSTKSYNASTDYTLTFNYDNYIANHKTKSGNDAYAVKISGKLKARGGIAGQYQTQYFSKEIINVTYELGTGTIYFNGEDAWLSWNNGKYSVNRNLGTISITYNEISKTYDMAKSSDYGWTLPFAFTGGYLNDTAEWQ